MSRHQRIWSLTRATFCKILRAKYAHALEEGSDPEPEAPFIVVSNHGNFFDPWILGTYQRKALHIMMNDDGFRSGAISRWYLHGIGAFPKKKGASDLKAMKATLSFLKAGEPVLIFPEGQATWDGETQPIYGGIERMIKRARCPLVVIRIRGGFLSKPWWSHSSRKGRISVKRTVYSAEDLSTMDTDEIMRIVLEGIYNNDIEDQDNLAIPFSGENLALGAERLLWTCASCEAMDTLKTAGDRLSCTACGASWRVDAHCHVHGEGDAAEADNLKAWHRSDKARARERIAAAGEGDVLLESAGVIGQRSDDEGEFEDLGAGALRLTRDTLSFEPDDGGTLSWPVDALGSFAIQRKDVFEITADGKDVRFDVTGGSPMKWLTHVRYLNGWEEIEARRVI